MTDQLDEDAISRRRLWAFGAATVGAAAVSACVTQTSASTPAAADSDLITRLDAVEARGNVIDILFAYARANDRKDEALLRSCFWPESTHRHGRFDGTSTDFIDFAFGIISGILYSTHHISNVTVEVDGDRAFSECYYFAHHRRPKPEDGETEFDAFFEGRYIDLHERRDGVWKIIQRRGVSDYSMVVPASDSFADWNPAHRSLNAPDDPYYALRQKFRNGA